MPRWNRSTPRARIAALRFAADPGKADDQTAANTPNLFVWAKVNTQRYAISSAGSRFWTYTYTYTYAKRQGRQGRQKRKRPAD